MGNAGRAISAVVASLVIGLFGWSLITQTDLDGWSKVIGVLICAIAVTAVNAEGFASKGDGKS